MSFWVGRGWSPERLSHDQKHGILSPSPQFPDWGDWLEMELISDHTSTMTLHLGPFWSLPCASLQVAVHLYPLSQHSSQLRPACWFLVIAFGLLVLGQNTAHAQCYSEGFTSGGPQYSFTCPLLVILTVIAQLRHCLMSPLYCQLCFFSLATNDKDHANILLLIKIFLQI